MKRLLPWTILIALSLPARADNVLFEARASSEEITLDQTVELTISLQRDGNQAFEGYRAPMAPDFEVQNSSTSEQMQWVGSGGHQTVRMIEQHHYTLKPRKKGTLTIGAAQVRIAGQEVHTRELKVHVMPIPKGPHPSAQQQQQPAGANGMNPFTLFGGNPLDPFSQMQPAPAPPPPTAVAPAPEHLKGDEDLFLDGRVDKTRVYVGEQLTASYRLYTQSQLLKYRTLAEPKNEDFWAETLYVPSNNAPWERQVIHGHEYQVLLLLKRALFPLKAGQLTISPYEAEATTMTTAFYANASDVKKSKPFVIEVLPLPVEGRPIDFEAANIGKFEISASADRTKLAAGEAVKWQIALRGAGNLRNIKLTKMEQVEGFKVYEPTVKENVLPGDDLRGEKVFTYLLMPERGGALTLPEVSFAFFDPHAAKYQTVKTQAIPITVVGDPSQIDATSPTVAPQENVLAIQIRPIRNRTNLRSRFGERMLRGSRAALILALPPGIWILVLIADALRRRLSRETTGSKRRRARRSARRRLRAAEYQIKAMRPSAFFGECARVVYEHIEFRLGTKVEALTLSELRGHLESRGFPKETSEAVVQELENCDFARFAPSASGPGEMRAALRRVRTLLTWIERVKLQEPAKKEAA